MSCKNEYFPDCIKRTNYRIQGILAIKSNGFFLILIPE